MLVSSMAGHRLVTKQTPKDGILVRKVMVAESVDILRETYFCILMDRCDLARHFEQLRGCTPR